MTENHKIIMIIIKYFFVFSLPGFILDFVVTAYSILIIGMNFKFIGILNFSIEDSITCTNLISKIYIACNKYLFRSSQTQILNITNFWYQVVHWRIFLSLDLLFVSQILEMPGNTAEHFDTREIKHELLFKFSVFQWKKKAETEWVFLFSWESDSRIANVCYQ